MKQKIPALLMCTAFALVSVISCKKEARPNSESLDQPAAGKVITGSANCADGYGVTLSVDHTSLPGGTIFTWTITNVNPGNGKNGTNQNLSHWSFKVSDCMDQYWGNVVEASVNSGSGWTVITPLPDIQPDPSQGCYNGDVFKFNYGTSGATPTMYRLVLWGNWGTADMDVYFKSGTNTGCCSKTVGNGGVGCLIEDDECNLSQGYWFANNANHPDGVHPWTADVTVGGKTYTNAEGLAIWNTSNAGGITDSKKAFTQLAAIRLSGVDETNPALAAAVATIDGWLGSLAKLSPAYLPNQSSADITTYGDARAAANAISAWINANHCP